MRLVVLIPTLELAGAQRVMVTLANTLADLDHDTHVVCLAHRGPLAAELADAVGYHQLDAPSALRAVPALRRLLGDLEPAAVISALQGSYTSLLATAGRRARPRLIAGHHNRPRQVLALDDTPRARATLVALAAAYRACDEVVVVTKDSQTQLAEMLRMTPDRFTVLDNPVDLDQLDRRSREDQPHPWLRDPGGLVLVASLTTKKRVEVAIETMTHLPHHRLVVLGDGPLRPQMDRVIADHGLGDRVTLAGAKANPFPDMAAADAVLSTSESEALPLGLIEAVCLGARVVTTDSGAGTRSIVADYDGAATAASHSPVAIAEAISSLVSSRATAEQIEAKRRRFDRFTVAQSYLDLATPAPTRR